MLQDRGGFLKSKKMESQEGKSLLVGLAGKGKLVYSFNDD